MDNLAGTPREIANLQVRAELAVAGVSAYSVTRRELEVKADIVGAMRFDSAYAVFSRNWYYWVVRLSQPLAHDVAVELNAKWSETVRVDGYAGGKEPAAGGVWSYHVDTQEGLNALVATLVKVHGAVEPDLPSGHRFREALGGFVDFVKTSLETKTPGLIKVDAPSTPEMLAELQISALCLLGGTQDDPCARLKLALAIACKTFGDKSEQVHKVRVEMANVLRARINRLRDICPGMSELTSRYVYTFQLEQSLSEREALLWELNRGKEARSVKRERNTVRTTLVEVMQSVIAAEVESVRLIESGEKKDVCDLLPHYQYQVVATTWVLAKLQERRDEKAIATELFAQAHRLAEKLNAMYAKSFAALVKRT